jgi:hypothetical protein
MEQNKKQGRGMSAWPLLAFSVVLASCSPIEQHDALDRPTGRAFASVGDLVLRVNKSEDLPNISGHADIWGRTRGRGFTEIRYLGLTNEGAAVFRRLDVDVETNETTLTNSPGFSIFHSTLQGQAQNGYGNLNAAANGYSFQPSSASVSVMPPNAVDIVLGPNDQRVLTVGRHGVEIMEATKAGVTYSVY